MSGIPWRTVNIARFEIGATRSNSYTAAGGSPANPYPVPDSTHLGQIRRAQEIALARPIAHDIDLPDGSYRESVTLTPYATTCLWITPSSEEIPASPEWVEATVEDGDVILRWTPTTAPWFFSYELFVLQDGEPAERLSPDPLRAALWVDTAPPPGPRRYGVRSVSATGIAGGLATSAEIVAPAGIGRP
jgi:hypothetical protein